MRRLRRSIFETVLKIFHNLILEGNQARLCLPLLRECNPPPSEDGNLEPHRASGEFTIEDQTHTARGEICVLKKKQAVCIFDRLPPHFGVVNSR
jgi:hypothetical protein